MPVSALPGNHILPQYKTGGNPNLYNYGGRRRRTARRGGSNWYGVNTNMGGRRKTRKNRGSRRRR